MTCGCIRRGHLLKCPKCGSVRATMSDAPVHKCLYCGGEMVEK